MKPPTTKLKVLDVVTAHPTWTRRQVADYLGIHIASVRTIGYRAGLDFPLDQRWGKHRRPKRIAYAGCDQNVSLEWGRNMGAEK